MWASRDWGGNGLKGNTELIPKAGTVLENQERFIELIAVRARALVGRGVL